MPISYFCFFLEAICLLAGATMGLSLYIGMAWWTNNWSIYFDLGDRLVLLALFVQATLGIFILKQAIIPFVIIPLVCAIHDDFVVPYVRARDAERRGLQWDKNSPRHPR